MTKINRPKLAVAGALSAVTLLAIAVILAVCAFLLGGCNPLPGAVTPDEAPALTCPCPDFVLSRGGVLEWSEDPDSPGPCSIPTNCGHHVWIGAEDLYGCRAEALGRAGSGR